jgi:hypothetical protein
VSSRFGLVPLAYQGGYTAATDFLRAVWPALSHGFEIRFEIPPGCQAQGDFAHFRVEFSDQPGIVRILWLFTMVLGIAVGCGPFLHRSRSRHGTALSY